MEGHNRRGTKAATRNNCLKLLWEVTRSDFEQQEKRKRHLGPFAKSSPLSGDSSSIGISSRLLKVFSVCIPYFFLTEKNLGNIFEEKERRQQQHRYLGPFAKRSLARLLLQHSLTSLPVGQ